MSSKRNFLLSKVVLSLLILSTSSYASTMLRLKNVSAYDGDTIRTNIEPINGLSPLSIRLYGIDTPELRGKCEEEKALAKQAKTRLNEIISNGIKVEPLDWDKYGGRFIANVFTMSGENVSRILINEGLAREYYGGRKSSWCSNNKRKRAP